MTGWGDGQAREAVAHADMRSEMQQSTLAPHPTLSTEQCLAALNLAYSKTRAEAAQAAGVSEATIYRWLQRWDFQGYLQDLKRQRLGAAKDYLEEAHRTIREAAPAAARMLVEKGVGERDVTAINSILDRAGVARKSSRDLNVRVRRETYESRMRQTLGLVVEGQVRQLPAGDSTGEDDQDDDQGEDRGDDWDGDDDEE